MIDKVLELYKRGWSADEIRRYLEVDFNITDDLWQKIVTILRQQGITLKGAGIWRIGEDWEHRSRYSRYYWTHRERKLAYSRMWRRKNKERCREWARLWYERNREHKMQYSRLWYEKNKEYWKQHVREYYRKNREKILAKRKEKQQARKEGLLCE